MLSPLLLDAGLAMVVFLCSTFVALRWFYGNERSETEGQKSTARSIAARLAILVTAAFGASLVFGVQFWVVLIVLFTFTLLSLGTDLALPAVVLGWGLKQWVFGFPDADEVVLSPASTPRESPVHDPLTQLVGQRAMALAPLKPAGEVMIGPHRYAAASESGAYVDADSAVTVMGVKNGMLLVREAAQ